MDEASKKIKQELERLNNLAYERNIEGELSKLDEAFQRWRGKKLTSFELTEAIHSFHKGPAKELYVQYQGASLNSIRVASAIVDNLIKESEVSPEVMKAIANQIRVLRD